jgi:putative PIN family toxin of toxin-antitoxin system
VRAVFDTNVVISALVFGRRLAWLRAAWASRRVVPIVCRQTVDELLRVLTYPKFRLTAADRAAIQEDYLPFAEIFALSEPYPALHVECRDRDDMVFLALAIAADAALISGDEDLAVLRAMAPIEVIAVAELRCRLEV